MPSNEDFFVHRAGRTARAGKTGINIVIGDEYEMNQFARLEKKLGLKVYPKMLFKGKLVSPSELEKKRRIKGRGQRFFTEQKILAPAVMAAKPFQSEAEE